MYSLSRGLSPDRVIFLSDVAGVYSEDPKLASGNARLFSHILISPLASTPSATLESSLSSTCISFLREFGSDHYAPIGDENASLSVRVGNDSTGGFLSKIDIALKIAQLGMSTLIFSVDNPSFHFPVLPFLLFLCIFFLIIYLWR